MNTVNFNDFTGENSAQRFDKAAQYLKENSNTKLIIPAGEYIISREKVNQLQKDVMYGKLGESPESKMFSPNMQYDIGFNLVDVQNVEIEAYGVTLLLDGFMEGVNIKNCQNISIKGIHIDLLRKAYIRGKIIESSNDYTDVDFGELSLVNERMPSGRIAVIGKESALIEKIADSKNKEALGDGKFRFYGFNCPEHINCDIYIWHTYHFRPAIHIYDRKSTTLEEVCIFNSSGMGVVGFHSTDVFMRKLQVVPSYKESISTNTDATHFASCRGKIEFTECSFEGHGDDATNVHGYYYDIAQTANGLYRLSISDKIMTHSCKLEYPLEGDILELSKKSEIIPIECFTVERVILDNNNWCCYVELNRKLPDNIDEYCLTNQSATPSLLFKGCHVKNHIARGVLVKTNNVLIENCIFDHDTGTAIHVGAESYWREGLVSNNVIIRNNRIINSGYLGWGRILDAGGISINILSDNLHSPAHKNFIIENNVIDSSMTKHAIYAGNIDGILIKGNTLTSMEEPIVLEGCINTKITGNKNVKNELN